MPRITGAAIATDAEQYAGAGYTYGGDASKPGDWDCSSFVSYVLGHDLRLALPGGKWAGPGMPPAAHGPMANTYASWSGAATVGNAQAGDLCIWVGAGGPDSHIGIAVSGTEMVSALNSDVGTAKTGIVGFGPPNTPLIYRRILGVPAGGVMPLAATPGQQSPNPAAVVIAVLAPVIVIGVLGLAATLLAAGSGWALQKALT
jgi:cell wall-associated NlpC family hydrolase